MKKDIHPKYHTDAKIICACGNIIQAGSTVQEMKVEICSACHPFYTGKKKSLDATGRVDRFKKLTEKTAKKMAEKPARNASHSDAGGAAAKKVVKKAKKVEKVEKKEKPAKKTAKKK